MIGQMLEGLLYVEALLIATTTSSLIFWLLALVLIVASACEAAWSIAALRRGESVRRNSLQLTFEDAR